MVNKDIVEQGKEGLDQIVDSSIINIIIPEAFRGVFPIEAG